MPYGIPDETPAQTEKMHDCIAKVMAEHEGEKDFTKVNAIRICKSSIMGFTIEIVQDPTEINAVLGGNYLPGELLRWENMELAKAEVNANRDELSDADITSIAQTLPLMPIDDDHKQDKVVGIFTAARNDGGRLLTDGILYARRYPEVAQAVLAGKKRPSIEAHADLAVCSICGSEFTRVSDYCAHLRDKHGTNAVRSFKGNVRGVGGGLVWNPAGSSASFNPDYVYMVASHEIEAETDDKKKKWSKDVDLDEGSLTEIGWPSGEKIAQAVKSGKVSYAKAVHKLSYLANVSKDASTVSKAKSVMEMLKRRFGDNESKGGAMTIEEVQAQFDEAVAKLEKLETEKSELQTAKTTLQASLDDASAKVVALTAELEALRSANKSLVEANRRSLLASVLTDEEFAAKKDVILAMTDEMVTLLAEKGKPAPAGTQLTVNLGGTGGTGVATDITL